MTKYDIFENIIRAYEAKNEDAFNYYSILLLSLEDKNPYELGYEEANLFNSLPICYLRYKHGGVGDRKAKKDIITNMKKILKISTMNPYSKDFFIKKANDESVVEPQKEDESVKEPIHVLGILPEEANDDETTEEPAEEKKEQKETKEEPAVEQKEEPVEEPKEEKRLFGRRKKR